ncbi:MAG: hypothetical protein J6Y94_05855, partial [Bacteriovoracaceae bacterium]|nr:hypothetical protein [Bacteriovoracaceae bacterium]
LSPRRPFDKNKSGPSAAIYHAHRLALEKFLACTKAPQPSTSFPQCWIKSTKKTTPPSKNSPVPPQIIILGDFNISLGHPALPGAPWINLWYTLPPEERWESVFQGAAKSLAHIFLEDSFLQRNHLQLRPQSFTVQRDFLLHPDHTPLRRQWLKTKRHGQNHYQFSGAGYSDHLPLQVAVAIWPTPPGRPLTTQWHKITPTPSSFSSPSSSSSPFSPLTTCPTLRETAINKRQIGRCFTVDFTAAPQTLKSAGVYRHNYVLVDGQKLYLVLAATGSAAQAPTAQNLCFNRHVLQKRGGRLVKAQGKLGFFKDGFALYIARVAHLHLDHLSRRKAEACSFRDEARP